MICDPCIAIITTVPMRHLKKRKRKRKETRLQTTSLLCRKKDGAYDHPFGDIKLIKFIFLFFSFVRRTSSSTVIFFIDLDSFRVLSDIGDVVWLDQSSFTASDTED